MRVAEVRKEVMLDLEVQPACEPGQQPVVGSEVHSGSHLVGCPLLLDRGLLPLGTGKFAFAVA